MTTKQRRIEESVDSPTIEGGRRGSGVGTLLFATALGVGVGLLTAPDTGRRTRKRLRKRLGDVQDHLGGMREVGARSGKQMQKRMRKRLARLQKDADSARRALADRWEHRYEEEEEDEDDRGILGAALWVAAGAAVAYLLTADGAAPARAKMQTAATDLRRRAADRWDQFQRGGMPTESGAGAGAGELSPDETPQAS